MQNVFYERNFTIFISLLLQKLYFYYYIIHHFIANHINSNIETLGGFTPVIDSTGKITGYKTEAGADTVFPFSDLENFKVQKGGGTGGFTINATCESDGKAIMFCGSRSYSGTIYFRKNGSVFASSPVNNTIVYLDRIIDVKKGDKLQLQHTEVNSNYYTAGCIAYP